MARGRAATIISIVILAVACLPSIAKVKVHAEAASLNETVHYDDYAIKENVVLLSHESENKTDESSYDHPHRMSGKPTKFDIEFHTDDKADYQIEPSRMINVTANPIEMNSTTNQFLSNSTECREKLMVSCIRKDFSDFLDQLSRIDTYNVTESVQIIRNPEANVTYNDQKKNDDPNSTLLDKVHHYARTHVMKIQLNKDLGLASKARTFFGSFGLKKLLLPLLFGVQIIKSILLALFLPSIIGSIGNIVGKGVSSFAQSSHNPAVVPEENFEFKDNTDLYNDDYLTRQPVGTLPASAMYDESMMQTQKSPDIASRYAFVDTKISHANALSDRYYTRHVASHGLSKKQDFKVFHEIPTSSLLLTNYDPFYSPLLSRLDAVFFRLGHNTEGCREYAVCAMYRSPARYAPYSNLVSAQLSRELNELRKPSSDNPDVLRFFRYMKAAKDGQDGVKCEEIYAGCANGREDQVPKQNQAMLATYQDINKLVQARKI
ncbi:Osiris 24-like protein [Camponotus japonicus]